MNKPLPISLYCDWLDATYLGRQRRLHEWFGDLGLGQAEPALDGFVSLLLPYHTMIVPVLLGMKATIQEVGGWQNHPLDPDQAARLEPVDIADSSVGDLLLAERERRVARYGRAAQMLDLASASNNAFSLRGAEFYLDLLAEPELARHYLGVITETMLMAYGFVALWDVDPAVAPGELGAFLRALAALARRHGREPQFGFIPITWEELDWEFPRYHQNGGLT